MIVPDRLRLPLHFDVDALAAEAAALARPDWVPHFNRDIYQGEWAGVALRSVGGRAGQLYPDPAADAAFADTEVLAHSGVAARPGSFECPKTAARLLALAPGAVINEHRDYNLGWADGEVRLHVPVVSNPQVEFVLDGRPVEMAVGEAWYLDLSLPHRVANRGRATRVHLVLDCVVDDWLEALIGQTIRRDPPAIM